jgi:hypothetical protein
MGVGVGEFLVTTAWRVIKLRIEEMTSVCGRFLGNFFNWNQPTRSDIPSLRLFVCDIFLFTNFFLTKATNLGILFVT